MPTICRFYGMIVRMNLRYKEHNPPHVHVSYGEHECLIGILDLAILAGALPPKAKALATEWMGMHKEELLMMWETQNFYELPPLE